MYKIINKKKLMATRAADAIGGLIFLPGRLMRKPGPIDPGSVREILVIRTAYIGDLIMTLPLLKPLKRRFPSARITVLTARGAAPVLENNPYVDEVATFNPFWFYPAGIGEYFDFIRSIRKKSFDLVIEARGDIREILMLVSPLKSRYRVSYDIGGGAYLLSHVVPYAGTTHKVDFHLNIGSYLGCPRDEVEWGFYLTAGEKERAGKILESRGIEKPFIAAHPGSRLELKKWPSEYCARLYDALTEKYSMPLAILGTDDEIESVNGIMDSMKNRAVSLAGNLGIRDLAAILGESSLFICNDSAPMHVAASMKTPVVALFGPSKSIETAPYGGNSRVVEKDFPCRYSCDESTCLHSVHQECMRSIQPGDVLAAVDSLMSAQGANSK